MLNPLILPGARVPVVSFCLTLFLVLVAVPAAAQTSDPATNAPSVTTARESEAPGAQVARPRVGLALGGGAARGIAHIGVLRWFWLSQLRGRYSASAETAMDEDLRAVASDRPIV